MCGWRWPLVAVGEIGRQPKVAESEYLFFGAAGGGGTSVEIH